MEDAMVYDWEGKRIRRLRFCAWAATGTVVLVVGVATALRMVEFGL
jgi:hypothetical protein